jgi:hypothetical protein
MERLTTAELRRRIEANLDEVIADCLETGGLLLWHALECGAERAAECLYMEEFEAHQYLRLTRAYIELRNCGVGDEQAIAQLIETGHGRDVVNLKLRDFGWMTNEATSAIATGDQHAG